MKVAITGASGLVGAAVSERLRAEGDAVLALVRRPPSGPNELYWNPGERLDPSALAGVDAVVHLAGKSIGVRWTARAKREIVSSRVEGTVTISRAVSEAFRTQGAPEVLVSVSAIGYYGNREDGQLTEESGPGVGFLPELALQWERAADMAREAGVRVVHPRMGMILSREGGALEKMLLPFKLGIGGRIGNGRQYWSWIALADVVEGIVFSIRNRGTVGAVNLTAPHPVRNREFTSALGAVLRRPTILPTPSFATHLFLGEGANELLLASARVIPARLQHAGFEFRYPELRGALEAVLGASPAT